MANRELTATPGGIELGPGMAISSLRDQITAQAARLAPASTVRVEVPVRIEVPVLDPQVAADLKTALAAWVAHGERLLVAAEGIRAQLAAGVPAGAARLEADAPRSEVTAAPAAARASTRAAGSASDGRDAREALSDLRQALPKAQRAVLAALAQHGTRTTVQLALLTGYSHKSGGYSNALSSLRTAGLIEGRGDLTATPAGLDALGTFDPLPAGPALREWWKEHHLGRAEKAILDVIASRAPDAVDILKIAELTGYSSTSGGFRNTLSRLRSLELASGRGALQLNPTLAD